MIRLCVLGAGGRMGKKVLELCAAEASVRVVAAVERAGSDVLGAEVVPGVRVTADMGAALADADVYIDFTAPEATLEAARAAHERGVAAVIGTTGLGSDALAVLDALSARVPVLMAPNFSLGVNLLLGLAERAARALGPAFDLEVVEIHHRHKRDAPSGTALAVAEALARGRDSMHVRAARAGDIGPRGASEIGVMAVRGGDVVGEHTAYFLGPDERLEITHRAGSRTIFAAGALRAAMYVAGKPAGRYTMADVLGL